MVGVRGQPGESGPRAALVAASALLVDYVLTVAVSVAAGVDAISLRLPGLGRTRLSSLLLFIAVLALMNLRGVKESGAVFAIPTYGFIAVTFGMIGWGFWRMLPSAPLPNPHPTIAKPLRRRTGAVVLIALTFRPGCTA